MLGLRLPQITVAALVIAAVHGKGAAAPATTRHSPEIRLAKLSEWQASAQDVHKVLNSVAAQLCPHFPDRDFAPIIVEPRGGPITLYARGPAGEYRVRLNTGGLYWSQYAYQFAHELCHILCNCRPGNSADKWFEESLCELASIYTIRAMARSWRDNPPYPNWRDYAPKLESYARNLMDSGRLPRGITLRVFVEKNLDSLRRDAGQRERNRVVAVALLPLFEAAPEHWEALQYLNSEDARAARSFAAYLADWRNRAPTRHKRFIAALARELGITLPD